MAGTQFSKECKDCHQQIVMQKQGDTWHALNTDFTPHICANKSKAQVPATPNGSAVIGRITEYEGSNVHVGKKILFILPEYRNSWKEKYPVGTPVSASNDKGTCKGMDILTGPNLEKFLKQEEAQKQQQPLPEEKPPAQQPAAATTPENPKDRTSPKETPATKPPKYDTSKIKEITIGGTISVLNFENVKIEVTGTDPEEIRKCLIFTASTLGGGHEPTKELIAGYIKRVLHKGGDEQ